MLADGLEPVIDLKKSHGSWFVDKRDGKEYLGFILDVCLNANWL